ncbi:MAG: DUF5320 domain-containing protein [Deltaproteobacteria bacterium]|nr:DUF5320 domain-containing protein [Deltaproteobacteria bacterium]
MPRGDRTGPTGMGPRTGRAAGFCAGYGMPGYANPGFCRGFGAGLGRGFGGVGRGRRNRFYATGQPGWARSAWASPTAADVNSESERQALRSQARALKADLDLINKRLAEIDAGAKTGPEPVS